MTKYEDFKANSKFIQSMKDEFKITSRKITKFVTRKSSADEDAIQKSASTFAKKISEIKSTCQDRNVWNTDQSGFNYELISNRTLSDRGEKDTLALVQSVNSLSQSYTIQPLLSNDGFPAPKLFIVVQEKSGKFGPRVQDQISKGQPSNIIVTCTTSGKMMKSTLAYLSEKCPDPLVSEKTLLIQDSWSGQKDLEIHKQKVKNIGRLRVETMPPRATKYCQPLDVYFFRQ